MAQIRASFHHHDWAACVGDAETELTGTAIEYITPDGGDAARNCIFTRFACHRELPYQLFWLWVNLVHDVATLTSTGYLLFGGLLGSGTAGV